MKILLPTPSFYPAEYGGPNNTLYWLCRGLIKSGYEVFVVTTDVYIPKGHITNNKWLNVNGINVYYIHSAKRKVSIRLLLLSLKLLRSVDAVITGSICESRFIYINLYALILKKRVIISPRGELFRFAISNQSKLKAIFKKSFFYFLKNIYANKVIYHGTSQEEIKLIKHYFGRKSRSALIFNYIEMSTRFLYVETNNPYFLYVGRITKIKALDNLVRGLSLSKEFKKSNVKFIIAGYSEGEYRDHLQTIINEEKLNSKIVFVGIQTGEEKNRLYANAKFLYLISYSENFGNVVMEALAQGTPAVTSTGTPWQILKQKKCGFWINNCPESIAEITDKILLMDDIKYLQMRKNSFEFCSETFDIYKNIDKWITLLSN